MCDMGFLITDVPPPNKGMPLKFHKLIKQTESHMIVVTYRIKSRLIINPKREDIYQDSNLR